MVHFDFIGTRFDFLEPAWTHLDSLGLAWIHWHSVGFTDSLGLTWTHLDSLGFTWFHLDSLGPTWTHFASLGSTWTHLDSCGLTRFQKGNGKGSQGKREKGKGRTLDLICFPLGIQTARTHARTHGATRNGFLVGSTPPASD